VARLIDGALRSFDLDMHGMSVLTEAASGPFVVTPLLAAASGAEHVLCCTRDSSHGTADEVRGYTMRLARELGVASRVEVTTQAAAAAARIRPVNVVTNLGFVRPIDAEVVAALPSDAAISLMWEPWELRREDLDVEACRTRNIPVLGTCETDPRLMTFRFVGMVVLRLLFEAEVEVLRSRVLVVGSDPFGSAVAETLTAVGAQVARLDPTRLSPGSSVPVGDWDAVTLVEHRDRRILVGPDAPLDGRELERRGTAIVRVCGAVDDAVATVPQRRVAPGYMSVTTDHVGPRPVVDLHAAGLRVGQALVEGMRLFGEARRAEEYALERSPALALAEAAP
jgi:hypothetical protein